MSLYDEKYRSTASYWGMKPSNLVLAVLELAPPERSLRVIDIGCGEGRNAVFFARNGYRVTAFDLSSVGVEKTLRAAEEAGARLEAFQADLNSFRLSQGYDIIFSVGALHYVPEAMRSKLFENYRQHTAAGGLNVYSVFVNKPFISRASDAEDTSHRWISGELFTYYHDWKIELCNETIFDCMSSGVPHQHATNRLIARNISAAAR